MAPTRSRLAAFLVAVFGAVPVLGLLATAPVQAQELEEGDCPPSVDTVDEGWICSLLILNTPSSSPSGSQIALWSDVLEQEGRRAVVDGIVFSDVSVEAKVTTLYESQLGRQPDAGGLAYWRDRVQTEGTEFVAEYGIFGSGEYLSRFESAEAFINDQYRYYLGREASRDEQAYWAGRFIDGELSNEGITRAIATSTEAGNIRAALLYDDYARRDPDAGGLAYWGQRAAGQGLYSTIVDFAVYPEMVAALGRIGLDRSPTDEQPAPLPALTASCSSSEGFTISYPEGWEAVSGCGQFGPAPVAEPAPGTDERPGVVSAFIDAVPFGDASDNVSGERSRAVTTVDGLQAVRVESESSGALYPAGTATVTWLVDLAVGVDDGPGTLFVNAVDVVPGVDFDRATAIMDRMVRTLDIETGDDAATDGVVARFEGGGTPFTASATGAASNPATCIRLIGDGDVPGGPACVEAVGEQGDVALVELDGPSSTLTAGIASPDVFAVDLDTGDEVLTVLPVPYPARDSRGFAAPVDPAQLESVTLRAIDGSVIAEIDASEAIRPADGADDGADDG